MKTDYKNTSMSLITLSVRAALILMFAVPSYVLAEGEDEVATLTKPTNTVEVGIEGVSESSAKFGEYNGLNKSGADAIGNFNIRGGDAYGQGTGTTRWEMKGVDLGTTSRSLGVNLSNQGSWEIGIKYDELQHNITDSYQTPLQGSMGGNTFTLGSGFGIINTGNPSAKTSPATNVNAPYGTQALTPTQKGYFHTEDVHTDRKNTTFSAGYNIEPQWNIKFEFNHLDQSGAKLISSSTDYQNKASGIGLLAGYAPTKEAMQVLMNPTNYKTDSGSLALNWSGETGHFTGSYNFSLFRDANTSVAFADPFYADPKKASASTPTYTQPYPINGTLLGQPFPMNALSTAPDNQFHQINLNGGYTITPSIKVVGGISYGRNTQNDAYVNQDQMQTGGLPKTSLNGVVVTTHADFKLTDQLTKDLTLNTGIKYNERDNRTASSTYKFYDLGGAQETAINTPLSNKKTQLEFSGDYRINQRQKLHFGYEYEQINRWCDSSPSAAQIVAASGGVPLTNYYSFGSSCVQVPESRENKLLANYRLAATEDVILTAGYAYARRNADVNSSFYNPMQANSQGFELPGYVAFFDGSRTENLVKAGLNWQASEKLSIGVNGRYTKDDYDASLGVQSGDAWSVNLDSAYNLSENTIASAYFTYQKRQRDFLNDTWGHKSGASFTNPNGLVNGVASSTQTGNGWTNNLESNDATFGLNIKHGGLLANKLDLVGDLVYSLSTSTYSTAINYTQATNTCTAASTSGYICGALPDIRSELVSLKLAGNYKLDKSSKVTVGYLYQHLNSNDYYYNAYQTGYTPTSMMPTNQQSPSYSVSMLYTAYVYEFR